MSTYTEAMGELVNIVLNKYDKGVQDDILLEELSELTKAILKLRRGGPLSDVVEEMAHVLISINVCKAVFNISDLDIHIEIDKKIKTTDREPKGDTL